MSSNAIDQITSATVSNTTATIQNTSAMTKEVCTAPTTTYNLMVNITGNGSVSASGLSCSGGSCNGTYDEGTTVDLTATPDSGYTFSGWGGDCSSCGTNTTCSITMDSDKTCTADFTASGGTGGGETGGKEAGGGGGGCSMLSHASPLSILWWLLVPVLVMLRRRLR